MLGAIKDALFGFIDTVSSLVEFCIDWIGHAVTFSLSLINIFSSVPEWLDYLPQAIIIGFLPVITMAIGLRIVGR